MASKPSIEHNRQVSTQPTIKDYISLLKPRVMSLVVFTGLIGLLIAPDDIHPLTACIAIFCIALGSGASGAINMWYEADIDAKMERTKHRAIPSGRMSRNDAIDFAVISAVFSVAVMAIMVNIIAAFYLLVAILFYVFIYTIWLKPRTPQNIVIGGAAGAFPPIIGWAAVMGEVTLVPWMLFLIIFFWTPPHFWALSLYRNDDYKAAGIPMLPVVKGVDCTKKHIMIYTLFLAIITALPVAIGMSGYIYGAVAIYLNAKFIWHAFRVYREPVEKFARPMFFFSLKYLFVLFLAIIVDYWIL